MREGRSVRQRNTLAAVQEAVALWGSQSRWLFIKRVVEQAHR
jgi:hypothetical protein